MALDFPSSPSDGDVFGSYTYDATRGAWRATPAPAAGLPAGTIVQWPTDVSPANWLICDGSAVSRNQYQSLFAVIGTQYGSGDSSTTFNLPNFKGRVALGKDNSQTEFDVLGETGGSKTIPKVGDGTQTGYGLVYSSSLGSAEDAVDVNLPPYQVVNYIIKTSAETTSGDSELASRIGTIEGSNPSPFLFMGA
jgi:hypothetical protein